MDHLIRVGVDEAGRGPLAGPVVAAAVAFKNGPIAGVADSKKLSEKAREALYPEIIANCWWAVGIVEAAEIDRINILQATLKAMRLAVAQLPLVGMTVEVDGNRLPDLAGLSVISAEAIVKGDAKVAEISAASIVAKVTRDRLMKTLAERYTVYGFDRHAGYGTAAHLAALAEYGPCPEHRRSFGPVAQALLRRQ